MDTKHLERMSSVARRAWQRLESEFPLWSAHLSNRDGELEFAIPAPIGSTAGHLVAFSSEDQLWVRFSSPNICYPADDDTELVSIIKRLTANEIVFKVVRKDGEWIETTLTGVEDRGESVPGQTVQLVSWSGAADANY